MSKPFSSAISIICLLALAGIAVTSAGCATEDRVVVRRAPAVQVVRAPVVVQERVVVR